MKRFLSKMIMNERFNWFEGVDLRLRKLISVAETVDAVADIAKLEPEYLSEPQYLSIN